MLDEITCQLAYFNGEAGGVENGQVIPSHTWPNMWLLIQAVIEGNP